MLGEHCGDCGNPLFRLRGEKLCAVCDHGEAVEKKWRVEEEAGIDGGESDTDTTSMESVGVEEDLQALAERLAREAREEQDIGRLLDTLSALETTLRLLERV